MSTEFEANHDAGGALTSYWDTVSDVGGHLTITVGAALGGSARGINAELGNTDSKFVVENITPPVSNELRLRFYFDPNSVSVPSGAGTGTVFFVRLRSGGSIVYVQIEFLHNNSGEYRLRAQKRDDNDVIGVEIFDIALTDEPHCVELREVRESSSSGFDGQRQIYLDGVLQAESLSVQNFARFGNIDAIVSQFISSVSVTGDMYADEYILDNDADANLGCQAGPATDEFTAALIARRCDIDMDGSFIYIGALNSLGQPTLIKFSTALNVDGSVVFSPGGGDDIGVQCGRKDADIVWVAGNFGASVVQKSEDAGANFSVKDSGFSPVTSFAVGPDSDERVLIFTDAGGSVASTSIYETVDDGDSWETKNSGLGLVSKAVERLDINAEELVTGNESSATDNIDYSPNSGEDLEDYSTGFPEVDVTSLVVG